MALATDQLRAEQNGFVLRFVGVTLGVIALVALGCVGWMIAYKRHLRKEKALWAEIKERARIEQIAEAANKSAIMGGAGAVLGKTASAAGGLAGSMADKTGASRAAKEASGLASSAASAAGFSCAASATTSLAHSVADRLARSTAGPAKMDRLEARLEASVSRSNSKCAESLSRSGSLKPEDSRPGVEWLSRELDKAINHDLEAEGGLRTWRPTNAVVFTNGGSNANRSACMLEPTSYATSTAKWCTKQPVLVSRFVRCVLPPIDGGQAHNPWVQCKCGHTCREDQFVAHVVSSVHEQEFLALLGQSEALGAQAAVRSVAEMVGQLAYRAAGEELEAGAVREEVASLQLRLATMEQELHEESIEPVDQALLE